MMRKINDALKALLDGGQGQNRTVNTRIFSSSTRKALLI